MSDAYTFQAALAMVLEARKHQIDIGYTPSSDDLLDSGELGRAVAAYAYRGAQTPYGLVYGDGDPPPTWPFAAAMWNPKSNKEDLARAAALIMAEIERLLRAEEKKKK
jgi:hypothetical protein